MNKGRTFRFFLFAAAGLPVALLSGCGSGGGGGSTTNVTPGRSSHGVVLRVQPGTDVQALAQQYGFTVDDSSPEDNLYIFHPPHGEDEGQFAAFLTQDPRCSAAEQDSGVQAPEAGTVSGDPIHLPFDFVLPSDSRYASLAVSYNSVPTSVAANPNAYQQVDLTPAQNITRGAGVTVAILDTGVQADHPSLHSRLLTGYNAIRPTELPADLADGTQNAAWGHGTMIAGVIARIAPDAKILPIRVLNGDGNGSVFNVVRGLRWAVQHGAQVVNLSFGTTAGSGILQQAIQDARHVGVVVVASAGNAGQDTRDYPAGFSDVLAVASVEADDTKSSYSNYGSYISLSAPGSGITSTFPNGGFATWSGTSFAAPFVSGAAALVRASHPGDPAEHIADTLRATARSVDAVNATVAGKIGRGVVDIGRAVSAAAD